MPTNTVLTNAGINFATSAFNSGILIAIKYCVPVYDYRLDGNIHNEDPAFGTVSISYDSTVATTSAATVPTGEKLWFNTPYNLSNKMILSGTSTTVAVSGATYAKVSNCPQSVVGLGVNTLSGVPLSNSISATTFYAPSHTDYWLIDRATSARVVGVNPSTYTDRSKFWSVGDYFPTVDSLGNVVGSFRAHLNQSVGRFKFNKVAFYAVSIDIYGNENLGVAPVFFAECFVSELAVKSNIEGEGFDDFLVDAQINMSPLNAYGTSGFFSTSGDYWVRTVGGLYSPDPIGVGSFVGSVNSPQSTVHVRYVQANQRKENLLRFDASGGAGDTKFILVDVNQTGDMSLSASMANRTLSANMSLDPISNNTFKIGTPAHRYAEGYINNLSANIITTSAMDCGYIFDSLLSYVAFGTNIKMESGRSISANDIKPNVNNAYDLGDPTHRYADGYINNLTSIDMSVVNLDVIDALKCPLIYNDIGPVSFTADIAMDTGTDIISNDIYPDGDNVSDLGDPTHWYAKGFINNLSAQDINSDTIECSLLYNDNLGNTIQCNSNLIMAEDIKSENIFPRIVNSYSVGSLSNYYASAFCRNIYADSAYISNISAACMNNISATNISASDLKSSISVADASSNADTNFKILTLSGVCGVIGDMLAGNAITVPSVITSANILNFTVMLEYNQLGVASLWCLPGTNSSSSNTYFDADYITGGVWNIIEITNRQANVNLTSTKYRITIMYAT